MPPSQRACEAEGASSFLADTSLEGFISCSHLLAALRQRRCQAARLVMDHSSLSDLAPMHNSKLMFNSIPPANSRPVV
jgi:hypothetical protein